MTPSIPEARPPPPAALCGDLYRAVLLPIFRLERPGFLPSNPQQQGELSRSSLKRRVWLLAQQVGTDTPLFVLGIFSDPNRAKAAVAEHTVGGEPLWKAVEWENGWPARHAAMLWAHRGEEIPLEFWIIPFLLNRSEMGDLAIYAPQFPIS